MKHISLILFLFVPFLVHADEKSILSYAKDDHSIALSFLFYPEFFYGKNLTFLNNNNPDQIVFFRSIFDTNLTYDYKRNDLPVISAKASLRSRSLWGNEPALLETTEQTLSELDLVFGAHRHGLFLSDFWIRELWLEFALNELFGIPWCNVHKLTIGAFSFELGRGISLGANYPSMPAVVGFYVDTSIDQYAWGAKLTVELNKSLLFDLYAALFSNRSALFDQTNEIVRANQYRRRFDGARGFGLIQYVAASRLRYTQVTHDKQSWYVEPYILYNYNPDLRVEFLHDGVSNLVTLGLMAEYAYSAFELGWEGAFNRGGQELFGIDRNRLVLQEHEGVVTINNDQVATLSGEDALATQMNQQFIHGSPQTAAQNGEIIGPNLQNKKFRFKDPASINYKGWFFVIDGSYIIKRDCFKVSAAFGIASGDKDPRMHIALQKKNHKKEIDYHGFIAINETYTGKRVNSGLLLNGFGSFPRILSFGIDALNPTLNILNATGFTNIVYGGFSADYNYTKKIQQWHINPNVLFYWQNVCSTRFDKGTFKSLSKFLGTEYNVLLEREAIKNLTVFAAAAFFQPGGHFKQARRLPINQSQAAFIKDKTLARESLLGNDSACYINMGFKYTF